jgi:transcriptional regulator with XRE-family HTH domain
LHRGASGCILLQVGESTEDRVQVPDDFAGRLRLALKVANLSAAALGAAVGVDKSVVSRWTAGRTQPTQHNLSRIAAVLAGPLPGFSVLAFEAPAQAFAAVLRPAGSATPDESADQSLPIPFGLLDSARKETARRGIEYHGIYAMYYWAFSLPGRIARMTLILRPRDGLIEARYGADGFAFQGWALLMLNRLYVILAEERFEAMAFLVTNAGQQPRARFITGILTGPAEGLLVPTASPVVLVRIADITGDRDADDAAFARHLDRDPVADDADMPPAVRDALESAGAGPVRVPYRAGDGT